MADLTQKVADARDALEELVESSELAAGVEGVPLEGDGWERLGERVERSQEHVGAALDITLRRFRRAVLALWMVNVLVAVAIVAAVVGVL